MGNGIGSLCLCSSGDISGRFNNSTALLPKKHDKPLGNSIFYGRPDTCRFSGEVFSDDDVTLMTFRSVSGATASANSSATASTSLDDSLQHSTVLDSSASFASSGSFTSKMMMMMMPLQHAPRGFSVGSSIVDGFIASPFDRVLNGSDEPLKKVQRSSSSHDERRFQKKPPSKLNLKKILSRAFLRSIFINKENVNNVNSARVSCSSTSLSGELSLHGDHNYLDYDGGGGECEGLMGCHEDLHWAQGRAGEDRVHIVICEDHGWVYVGIYDGFNGPDATDYLLNNLFSAVHDELKGLLCSHKYESMTTTTTTISDMAKLMDTNSLELEENVLLSVKGNRVVNSCSSSCFNKKKLNMDFVSKRVEGVDSKISDEEVRMKWECEGDGEKVDLEKRMKVNSSLSEEAKSAGSFSHSHVLQALSEALRKTEDAFLNTADEMITHDNPVLAMMGSCVLVMLMKGEDVYLMNVGDSRAVLANQTGNSFQLTMEHSTEVKEEVYRIKREHPDDPSAVTKGRVKGYLRVTRAFGVGFLKQPKQNNAVLETFKVNYIGDSPYITCSPSLHHHRLSPNDKFLILSSDGLYQYFTNEEAVAKVESFITMFPDRDPAQLLIEEALSRAAKKAGLNFHELLDIPQGERRLYHDDISIVIISFQGKIWRSLV